MLNYDMVGRLDDSTRLLNLNATGSSPSWDTLLNNTGKGSLQLKLNKSGISGSDQLPFYLNNIPVVFFFTGLHSDYHTPGDTPDKINYAGIAEVLSFTQNLLSRIDGIDSLAFAKVNVKEQSRTPARSGATLGIIPDHAYDGEGMRISGVLENRTAEKFGFQKNDIIIGVGDQKVTSIEDYMRAMSELKPGDTAIITVQRGGTEIIIQVTF
jgi:C-terminal processing protease CtpA/Prc